MSGSVNCPKCSASISPADVNVGEGVAFCRACHALSRLHEIVDQGDVSQVDVSDPPSGCAIIDDGVQTTIRASARSAGVAIGTLCFAGFWNGIVSVFVLIALSSTIYHIFGAVPSWFPAPPINGGSSGNGSNLGPTMPLGMLIFLWIFLMPFIVIGLAMIGAFFTSLFGRIEVRLRQSEGVVFAGCGPLGWKRRFDTSEVKSVKLGQTTWKQNEETKPVIVIECDRKIRLGSMLPDDRRHWMAAALRKLLVT